MKNITSRLTSWARFFAKNFDKIANGVIAAFAVIAAFVSYYSLNVSRDALTATKDALESAQRAWVVPTGAHIESDLVSPIRMKITFENTGNDVALNVMHAMETYVSDIEFDGAQTPYIDYFNFAWPTWDYCEGLGPEEYSRPIYPRGKDAAIKYALPHKDDPNITKIKDGRMSIVINGCTSYRTFNRTRYTPFCFYLLPKRGMGAEGATFEPCLKGWGYAT